MVARKQLLELSFWREFISQRLDRSRFRGLPLTLLTIAFSYTFFLFLGIIEDITTSDLVVAADIRIANLIAAFRSEHLAELFLKITFLGKWEVILAFAIAFSIIFILLNRKRYVLPLWLSVAGSTIFVFLGKLAFHRQRPDIALYVEHSFSFPSGHAAIAVALYGFMAYFLIRNLKHISLKILTLITGIFIALLIGFSRMYLGVHYFSDVWAGFLIGALWLITSIGFTEHQIRNNPQKKATISRCLLSLIPVIAAFIFYLVFTSSQLPELSMHNNLQTGLIADNINTMFDDYSLPKYTETLVGVSQEPLSFIIIADNDSSLIQTFQKSGWHLADKAGHNSLIEIAKDAFFNKGYASAPMTPSFWNSYVHDFGFEKSTDANTVRARHHARFWKTQFKTKEGKNIYAGTASLDTGIKWGITHKISPDIDAERELLFSELNASGNILTESKLQFVNSLLGQNFAGDPFFSDGNAHIIEIK